MSSNIKVQKICKYCGSEFTAKTTVTLYCGDICSKRAYKARLRASKVEFADNETQQLKLKPIEDIKAKLFLSVMETCNLVGISRRTLYRMLERGDLMAGKAGKRTIIRRYDIDRLFEPPCPIIDQTEGNTDGIQDRISECYSLGEVRSKFGISDKALHDLIKRNGIRKIKSSIFTYVPKEAIDSLFSL